MNRIILTKHPELLNIAAEAAVCIYHKAYASILPRVDNCEYIEFNDYNSRYESYTGFDGRDTVVFVGTNRIITPATRIWPVFEHVPVYLPEDTRLISVDISPYIGDIWRLWFHFYLTRVKTGDYTYSYLLESHYNAYLDGIRDENPLSYDTIRVWAEGHVTIDYDRYFAEPEVEIIKLDEETHAKYQMLKSELFDEYTDINKIIKWLSDFAKRHCKRRRIPQEHKLFESPDDIRIVRTDLKVDEYLTNKLLNKINEVNDVVKVLSQ